MSRLARMSAWLLLGLATGLGIGQAAAACVVGSAQPADFGSVGSITLRTTAQATSTYNAGIHCSGGVVQPWGAADTYFRVTFNSANGGLKRADDLLNYQLYASADSASNTALLPEAALDLAGLGVVDAVGLLHNSGGNVMPLYLTLAAGSNVAAGSYADTISLVWEWRYCTAGAGSGTCSLYDEGRGIASFPVNLVVQNDCTIDAADLDFGSAVLPSGFATASGEIRVACTKGSAYSVGLDDGRNLLAGRRNMRSAQGALLAYDVFQGAGSLRWGSVGAQRRDSMGADVNPALGLGVAKQVFNYNAKIYADQGPVPAGSYVDTILIDVAF